MAKFIIVKGDKSESIIGKEIVKDFEAATTEEAKKNAAEWLTNDGLPCSGPDDDVYSLLQIETTLIGQASIRQLWNTHLLRQMFSSKKD